MINAPHQDRWHLYLIHFDQKVGNALHYAGICRAGNLHRRMMVHLAGNGASLTRRAAQAGIGWTIVMCREGASPKIEQAFKRDGHYARHCHLCANSLPLPSLPMAGVYYKPVATRRQWSETSWT